MNAQVSEVNETAPATMELRVVKITTLRNLPEGVFGYAELHDERGVFRKVESVTMPEGPLKSWGDQVAEMQLEDVDGLMTFANHTSKGPAFPVFQRPKARGIGMTNERVTFYLKVGDPSSQKEIDAAAKPAGVRGRPKGSKNRPKITEADFPKPVKSEFASFGEFMKACRERKAAMVAAGIA